MALPAGNTDPNYDHALLDTTSSVTAPNASGPGKAQYISQYYDVIDRRYEFSGNQDIDGILAGSRWTSTTLTYSFPASGSFYTDNTGNITGDEAGQHVPFNAQQQTATRYALNQISAYTNLNFAEITESASEHADLRLSQTNESNVGSAFAFNPSNANTAGDIWFGRNGQPYYTTPAPGNWGQATVMHEIGHALGFKHGHENQTNVDVRGYIGSSPDNKPRYGSAALPSDHDGKAWSLMTYRSDPSNSSRSFQGDGFNQPQTYMQDDIAAFQYLYGANFNTNSGDTTYTWSATTGRQSIDGVGQSRPTSNKIFMTIWDGDGIDTYDFSNYSTNLSIDLNPGAFSTLSTAQIANQQPLGGNVPAPGNVANALLFQGDTRSLIENAKGGSGDDKLTGNVANNTLDGGSGADTMKGGLGDDAYFIDSSGDIVTENASEGTDTVYYRSSINYTLAANVENLTALEGHGGYLRLTGNALDNVITGASVGEFFTGGAGEDTIDGSGGTDTASYADHTQSVSIALADAGDSTVYVGGAAEDTLRNIENLEGGTQADQFTGNSSGNNLLGQDGDDTLWGGNGGHDLLDGGAGIDTADFSLAAGAVTVSIAYGYGPDETYPYFSIAGVGSGQNVGIENVVGSAYDDKMTGSGDANSLSGGIGNDTLDGGLSADSMTGGTGNDSYVVDNVSDQVFELAGEGTNDRVYVAGNAAFTSYTLAARLEIETLATSRAVSTRPLDLTGNEKSQTIYGNAGANVLDGKGGADALQGLNGADTFAFSTALSADNVDRIADFASEDTIRLSKSIFTALDRGTLDDSAFKDLRVSGARVDGDDHILYDAKGRLFYDADGAGGADAVLFAKVSYRPEFTPDDFLVV